MTNGKFTLTNVEQFEKADCPIEVTNGKSILTKVEQLEKVNIPILVTDSDVTESNLMHPENAPSLVVFVVAVATSITAWKKSVLARPLAASIFVTSALVSVVPLLGVKVIVGTGHSSSS